MIFINPANKVLLHQKKLILFFYLWFNFACCEAQENLRFYVYSYPIHAYVELDGKMVTPSDTGIIAKEGIHHLKVWLPDYQVIDSVIDLNKNNQNIFRIYLKLSPQYIAYNKQVINFKLKKFFRLVPPVGALIFTGVLYGILNNKASAYHKAALQNETDYSNTQEQAIMENAKESFANNRSNYKLYKTYSYGAACLAVIPIAWTIRVAIKNTHRKPPVLESY